MSGYAWCEAHLDQVRRHYGLLPCSLIAKSLGRTASAVRNQAAAMGLRNTGRKPWTTRELQLLRDLYALRGGIQLAVRLGRSERAVYRKASDMGLRGSRGNGNWRRGNPAMPLGP